MAQQTVELKYWDTAQPFTEKFTTDANGLKYWETAKPYTGGLVPLVADIDVPLIFDAITVIEDFAAQVIQDVDASIFDEISILENVEIVNNVYSFDVFDTVSIAEVASITDLVVELGPAVDFVGVVEDASMVLDSLNAEVDELVTALEQFLREMPINFEVAEQKGIAIITVSGW